jgi:hypothetical protein
MQKSHEGPAFWMDKRAAEWKINPEERDLMTRHMFLP